MKILLINPMASRKTPIKGRGAHFPIGIGLIAASLRDVGVSVTILDNETACLDRYELRDFVSNSECDLYGISAMAPQYSYVKGLSRMIKETRNKPVILGGPLATYSYDTVLNNTDIDFCVIGEGEETIIDLVNNLEKPENVTGISYREGDCLKVNSFRVPRKSRDDYPYPAYDLFDMEPYFKKLQVHYEGWGSEYLNRRWDRFERNIGMITGIGCPYHCKFCSRSIGKTRLRSIDNIIAEIKYLKNRFKIDGVRFIDELLVINEKRMLEFCQKIQNFNLIWSGQTRSNTFNAKIAKAMKDAGCVGIGLGLETGSPRLLEAMRKQVTLHDHKRAIMAARDNNLAIQVQILYGFPGEDRNSIEETIAFFKEVELPQRRFNVLVPLPGSDVYNDCIKMSIIADEDKYLEKVSSMNSGFASKRVLLNLTAMSDKEFEALLLYAEAQMEENYKKIFKQKNNLVMLKAKKFLSKQILRAKRIYRLEAWKQKIGRFMAKAQVNERNAAEIEDLYFRL